MWQAGPGGLDERQQRVAVAVQAQRPHAPARCRWWRPCATARRASGSTGAARRCRACAAAPARSCRRASAPRRCSSPAPRTGTRPVAVVGDLLVDADRVRACAHAHDCRYSRSRGGLRHTADADAIAARPQAARRHRQGRRGQDDDRRGARACWRRARPAHDRGGGRRAEPAAGACSALPPGASRASRRELAGGPVEHLDRPRSRAAGVAAGARRARIRAACSPPAAPSSTSPRRPRARRSS